MESQLIGLLGLFVEHLGETLDHSHEHTSAAPLVKFDLIGLCDIGSKCADKLVRQSPV
jgi:hypothetical protein